MTTNEQLVSIASACAVECARQHVGLDRVAFLVSAYDKAIKMASVNRLPSEEQILELAGVLEPSNRGRYRITPVTFSSGNSAAPSSAVPAATGRLFEMLDDGVDAAEFTHHFLAIHPFNDGNGRTAFILMNWIAGTLLDPVPLPEFKF